MVLVYKNTNSISHKVKHPIIFIFTNLKQVVALVVFLIAKYYYLNGNSNRETMKEAEKSILHLEGNTLPFYKLFTQMSLCPSFGTRLGSSWAACLHWSSQFLTWCTSAICREEESSVNSFQFAVFLSGWGMVKRNT